MMHSRRRRILALSIGAALIIGCTKAPARDCPEFAEAEQLLDEISRSTLDPTFGDPQYGRALAKFEAISEDCAQHGSAVTVAETIRSAMAQHAKESAAPGLPPPPSVQLAAVRGDDTAAEVAAYFREVDRVPPAPDGSDGKVYFQKLVTDSLHDQASFDLFMAQLSKDEAEAREMSPPEPCREFHRLQLEVIQDTRDVFQKLHDAIARKDAEEVQRLSELGGALKERERRLAQMKVDLKVRYRVR